MRHLFLALGVVLCASMAQAFDVTSCGQTVPARETGTLVGDLSCAAGVGVHLGHNATLDLNGHALAATADSAVVCDARRCRIISSAPAPGDVSGTAAADCIALPAIRGRMELDNVT